MCCVWVYWKTDHLRGNKQGISAAVEPGTAEMLNLCGLIPVISLYLPCGERHGCQVYL